MKKLLLVLISVIGMAGVTVASAVTSVASAIKSNKTAKKISKSIGKVEEISEDQISEIMVQKAVQRAANMRVDRYMQDTEDQVLLTADRDLKIQAKNAVEKASIDIREQAAEKISQQVAELNIEDLKTQVRCQAEKHVLEKLDGVLDDSATKFNEHIKNTQKIYDKISKAMAEKDDEIHVVLM